MSATSARACSISTCVRWIPRRPRRKRRSQKRPELQRVGWVSASVTHRDPGTIAADDAPLIRPTRPAGAWVERACRPRYLSAMNGPDDSGKIAARPSQAKPALLGVACGAGAALCWALGFVATRHGLKVGFTPPDLLMHRFLWSGIVFLPLVLRAGIGNLGGIGWVHGLVLMVLGGPVMSLISYTGFLFVPLGHGSVIQPSCATLGGLLLAAIVLKERISASRLIGALVIVGGLGVIGAESIGHIGAEGVQGDLIFVLTGLMFAGFGAALRHWRVSAVSAALVINVLSLLLLPIYIAIVGLAHVAAIGVWENAIQALAQGVLAG